MSIEKRIGGVLQKVLRALYHRGGSQLGSRRAPVCKFQVTNGDLAVGSRQCGARKQKVGAVGMLSQTLALLVGLQIQSGIHGLAAPKVQGNSRRAGRDHPGRHFSAPGGETARNRQ